jgi:hypothetical protein
VGYVTCGNHGCRCCWGCDRCPKCDPETGKIGKGDYCEACRVKLLASGHVWSAYFQNYVPKDLAAKHVPDHMMTKSLFDKVVGE